MCTNLLAADWYEPLANKHVARNLFDLSGAIIMSFKEYSSVSVNSC